mmetsp:Transcript_2167/g.6455  ORF Transcript_2167/g.6455 Transcript_2167/m.6455 type:complete len:216 (+) Transcript_2167:1319-1966(+)
MIRCKRGMPSFCYIHHGHNQATQRESPRTRIRQVLHTKIFGECVLCTRKSIYTYREQEYAAAHCACANAAHSLCKPLARLRLVLSSGCKLIAARYLVLPQLQLASIGACCCCAFEYHCIEYQRYRWTPVESDLCSVDADTLQNLIHHGCVPTRFRTSHTLCHGSNMAHQAAHFEGQAVSSGRHVCYVRRSLHGTPSFCSFSWRSSLAMPMLSRCF